MAMQQKGAYHIICLGESTSAGYPAHLEGMLNHKNTGIKFSVINRSLSGITTSMMLLQLEDNLNRYKPDMVITMMGINDGENYVLRQDASAPQATLFFKSFRTYKLAKLLWAHIVNKAREIGIHKSRNKEVRHTFLSKSIVESKQEPAYQNNAEETEHALNKTVESNNINEFYIELGRIYKFQGKFPQSEEMFRKIIELNPRNSFGYIELGIYYMERNELNQAEEMLKKAVEVNPKNDQAYVELGWCYRSQGKFIQAEEMFKKAVELNPKNKRAYPELGRIYVDQNKLSLAEEVLKKAIEINPHNYGAYRSLAVVYERMGRHDLAQEYFSKSNQLILGSYKPIAQQNYRGFKEILDKRKIRLVCVQYPMRPIESLKRIFEGEEGTIFVDNEKVFKQAVEREGYKAYFTDMFGGDFGHCTDKGNRLLAENIANVILKECFGK